jgi:hypothetical protein
LAEVFDKSVDIIVCATAKFLAKGMMASHA